MKHLQIRYLKQIIKKYINEEWIVQNSTLFHINQYKPLQNTKKYVIYFYIKINIIE